MTPTPAKFSLRVLADVPHAELERMGAGGKACGLARLAQAGFQIPPALVLMGASESPPIQVLQTALASLGDGPYAVRSSATDEDGDTASFAGQYVSVLDVESPQSVQAAITQCFESLHSTRAVAYRQTQGSMDNQRMAVVIQRLIRPRVAGVLFTADALTGRRDRVILDAVAGLGEALVSGERTPDHVLTTPKGQVVEAEYTMDSPLLSPDEIHLCVSEAKRAEAVWGCPLDLEWAIDADGSLWWLQARPITSLPSDPRELDQPRVTPTDVYTRCNIGEMMPGAVTPLTLSITARGIDIGLQSMMRHCGVQSDIEPEQIYVHSFFNHIFLNLTRLARITTAVAGSTTDRLGSAVCGRPIPEVDPGPAQSKLRQVINGLRYGRYILGAKQAQAKLTSELQAFHSLPTGNALEMWQWIQPEIQRLYRVYEHHLQSSAASGALTPALLEILAKGEAPSEEDHAQVAVLLRMDADVESADIVGGMQRMVDHLATNEHLKSHFLSLDDGSAIAWLNSSESAGLGELWRDYIGKHGHRVVRELELFEREWAADPTPL